MRLEVKTQAKIKAQKDRIVIDQRIAKTIETKLNTLEVISFRLSKKEI